jgi:hypothetical protein
MASDFPFGILKLFNARQNLELKSTYKE